MENNIENIAVFNRPTQPKNDWELLMWIILGEEKLLWDYSKTIDKKTTAVAFLRVYFKFIIPITIVLWLFGVTVIAVIDLPAHHSSVFNENLLEKWSMAANTFEMILVYIQYTWYDLMSGLALAAVIAMALSGGLTRGLILSLILGLAGGLALGLGFSFGLVGGLAIGLATGLAFSLGLSLAVGLTKGLNEGFVLGLGGGFVFGLGGGLGGGLNEGLVLGLVFSLVFTLVFYLVAGRLVLFPFYFFSSKKLTQNPLIQDANLLFLPKPLSKSLIEKAYQQPEIGFAFAEFLFLCRPLQKKLANKASHSATAGIWASNALDYESWTTPIVEEDKFQLKKNWLSNFKKAKQALAEFGKESNAFERIKLFKQFQKELEAFYFIAIQDQRDWASYYVKALDLWKIKASDKLKELEANASKSYPFGSNPYLSGPALLPERNKDVFLGRADLKERLSHTIETAQDFPMFLLQGQRRVGKTSLRNFLPTILGSQFKIVSLDLQGDLFGIPDFLERLRTAFDEVLALPETAWQASENWVQAWHELRQYFEQNISAENRVIFALDEYEELQKHLKKDVAQAESLLGAIRNFSQNQNRIVFLFIGFRLFSDLKKPNWGKFFVNAERFEVDYLDKASVFQLIEVGKLAYEEEAKQEVFQLANGHPSLTQEICKNIFEQATAIGEKVVTLNMIQSVVEEKIVHTGNSPLDVFINEFCDTTLQKQMALAVANKEEAKIEAWLTDNQTKGTFLKFEQYGFIQKNEDKQSEYRVPIFQLYIDKFGIALEE
jgi:AAA+ ATPase superfamily predicted ATPase